MHLIIYIYIYKRLFVKLLVSGACTCCVLNGKKQEQAQGAILATTPTTSCIRSLEAFLMHLN